MVKLCFHVSSISHFLCCVFVSSFFVKTLVSQPFPRPDQIEILLAFKNEFPILKCDFRKWSDSKQKTKSWTSKDVKSFDGVVFDNDTGVVTKLDLLGACLSGTLRANSSLFRFHHLRKDSRIYYNDFTGHIPSSWANLTRLESLDLSGNQLSGKIPHELASLSFLEYINVSHNKLSGQIPQSTQLGGQPKSSFEGNLNLCGLPLQESCFRYHTPSAPEEHHLKPPKREQVLNWKAVAMGYGPGVLFGLVIGQVLYSYKPVLFYKLFRL
ncbi:unnamed protein product [Brassica oleracea var. botrytis]